MVDLRVMPNLNIMMGSVAPGIVNGTLADVQPINHSLNRYRGHPCVIGFIHGSAHHSVTLPMSEIKSFAGAGIGFQRMLDKVIDLTIFRILRLFGKAVMPAFAIIAEGV